MLNTHNLIFDKFFMMQQGMIHLQVRFRYHARRMLQPKIPPIASEFCAMLPTTAFGDCYKFSVTCGNQTAVVFFSDKMNDFLTEVMNIQFDGTFFALHVQFFQLWTLFVAVGRHTLPAIHCLMTAKNQVLYQAILEILGLTFLLFSLSLQCQTSRALSAPNFWERAPAPHS